jgi:vancomycin resistance protein YoaR
MRSLRSLYRKLLVKPILKGILILISLLILAFSAYNLAFWDSIFPNINIAGVSVANFDPNTASDFLSQHVSFPQKITLVGQNQNFDLSGKDINLSYDYLKSAYNAFNFVRTEDPASNSIIKIKLLFDPVNLPLEIKYDEDKLSKFISVISGQVSQEPVNPSIKVVNGSIVVNKGVAGTEVDNDLLKKRILDELSFGLSDDVSIPVNTIDNTLADTEADTAKARAEKYVGKKLVANFEFISINIPDKDILDLLDLRGGFNETKIDGYSGKIAKQVNRESQNPKFTFDGGKVTEFQPALDGVGLDLQKFREKLIESLTNLESTDQKSSTFDIPVVRTPPDVTTDSVNNMGIKELIGRGTSTYFHSIPGRVYNVSLAAGRINGTLVKPGDTFSFNDTLGDVSSFTGYQQAYIISEGKTILGDGGGVCQVSTTLFRAILDAGLPVLERQAHAYRVGYYEQNSPPGLDATVYGPSPDFKFKNDTPAYILIQATANPKNYSLVFELYGASDGRVATISKPVVSGVTAPPEDLYQDDPSLPTGQVKQIDFKAWGAKVVFNYSVMRGGEQIYKKTFTSNYRPWQAVYLRGTGPVQ